MGVQHLVGSVMPAAVVVVNFTEKNVFKRLPLKNTFHIVSHTQVEKELKLLLHILF
jgi:hypothetical protein